MRVRLDHAGHQKRPGAVDDLRARNRRRDLTKAGFDNAGDVLALHQHVAGERRIAATVKDAHIAVEHVSHGFAF